MDNLHYATKHDTFNDVIECAISLTAQDYTQLASAHQKGKPIQLYLNTGKKEFYFVDDESLETVRKIIFFKDEKFIEDINLNQIKQWEKQNQPKQKKRKKKL